MTIVRSPRNWPGCVIEEDVWLSWGKLVRKWAEDPTSWPKSPDDLRQQLAENNVPMKLPAGTTAVKVIPYQPGVVYIPLPSKEMIEQGEAWMEEIVEQGNGKGTYPLPSFYELAFNGDQADLTLQELKEFNLRRIGEYTINLCG